jgi:hypothetical protein
VRSALGDHRIVGKPQKRRGSVFRSRLVADASGAPVLRDQGPIGRPALRPGSDTTATGAPASPSPQPAPTPHPDRYVVLTRPWGRSRARWAQESSYAAATRLGTTMRHASTTSSRISAWSIASSHTRTQL